MFPQKMVGLVDGSAIHSGLVETKAKFIAGEGLVFDGENADAAEEWFDTRVDIQELLENTGADMALLNGFNWEVIYDRGGSIDSITHKDITRIRSGELIKGEVSHYYFSSDWLRATKKRNISEDDDFAPVEIAAYNFEAGDNKQLIYVKSYKQGKDFYPEPEYIGALNWIEVGGKISQFYSTNLDNGFSSSTHIHVFGKFDDEQEARLSQKLNENLTGVENGGELVVTTGTTEEGMPVITELPTFGNANVFNELARKTNEEIAAAHRVPLALTNMPFASGMQSEGLAIKESLQLFQNTVIRPKQQKIERAINKILKDVGLQATVEIKPLTPVNFVQSDAIKLATQTVDELRKEGGLEPLEVEQVITQPDGDATNNG